MDDINDKETEKDINDVFDSIIFSEDNISNEAFKEGVLKGEEEGRVDGYHLGYHRGLELGNEIGFYKGLTKVVLDNFDKINVKNNVKTRMLVEKLNRQLENFPVDNPDDVDLIKAADDIRARYRMLTTLLRLNLTFPVSSVISF